MVELIHLAVTWALIGLIWLVQVVIYPQFGAVGRLEFGAYHADYTRRISWIVGPLMSAELGSAAWLLWAGERSGWFLISLGLIGVNWLSTAIVQVPLHRRLEQGFEAGVHGRLVSTNWVRTGAWTARGVMVAAGCL
ncbi:MAG: hypothetical protein NTZ29_06820 [Verrucomicrobia bacterium]|nr:hypothetical protein [Verrucomicrobiota bacterium]